MRALAFESTMELLTFAVELVAAVLLTILGIAAESAGLARLGAGVDVQTLWFCFVGALALYAGVYMLGYRTLRPRLSG